MFSFGIDVSRMHGNICDTHHVSDVSELKQRPTKVYSMAREKVWSIIVDDTMDEWHKRLWACIHAKEGTLSI